MLRGVGSLHGFRLVAKDGEIGSCDDLLFDDRDWVVRYMVADTGGWLSGRRVLICPVSLQPPDWSSRHFPVALTRQQIEDSPPLEEHAPVSLEYEKAYFRYYELPYYWAGPDIWGAYPDPAGMVHPVPSIPDEPPAEDLEPKERHLRSSREIVGYEIRSADGESEKISDILVDDRNWALRFVVVDTRRWLPGGKVLVPTAALHDIDWTSRTVGTTLDVETIKRSPPFHPSDPVDADYVGEVERYFGRSDS